MRALLCLIFILMSAGASGDQVLRSGQHRATLLELYTSEGCSSCPPADRWFSGLLDHPALWDEVVPVAFHVDYWNYLGWEDRFADPAHAQRQRLYRQLGITSGVYTPGVIAAGEEWRGWRWQRERIPRSRATPGVLEVVRDGGRFTASFAGSDTVAELTVALLGFGLATDVAAGENARRRLVHDFVVLASRHYPGSRGQWRGQLPVAEGLNERRRQALAAWVSEPGTPVPVQAVGGWLEADLTPR